MTGQVDIERLLDGWLADGPAVMPDGFLAAVAEGIARRPQRVTWRLRRTVITTRSLAGFTAAAVAIALIAVLGSNLIVVPPVGSPTPSPFPSSPNPTNTASPAPSTRPTASPPLSPSPEPGETAPPTPPPAAPGIYTMQVGPLLLTYTVPQGWTVGQPGESESGIGYASDPWNKFIDFLYDIYPPTGECGGIESHWEQPHTARNYVDYVKSQRDWSGTVHEVEIGGLHGWHLDGEIANGDCLLHYTIRWSDNIPFGGEVGPGPWNVYVLDDGHGSTLLMEVQGDADFVEVAQPVIDTFEFSDIPTPTPTPALLAGTYTSQVWQPEVTYTVPDGWRVEHDGADSLALASVARPGEDSIVLLKNAYQPTGACQFPDDWASPHTALEFMHTLQARSNWYGISTPVYVGGLKGWQVDGELYFEGCDVQYTVPSADGAPTRVKHIGHWNFYALDDGRGSTVLVSSGDGASFSEAAQSVLDSLQFATATPTRCNLPPGPPAPTPGTDQVNLESAFWLDPTDGYKYVVVGTGRDQSISAEVEVTLFNACGATERDIVALGNVEPGATRVVLASVKPGFVPVRIEVRQLGTSRSTTVALGSCTRQPDGGSGISGSYSTGSFLADVYFEAAAVYRDSTGSVIGADKVSLLHQGTHGGTTEFEIPQSVISPDVASVDFVCYAYAFHW